MGDSFDVLERDFGIMQMHFESISFWAHLRVLLDVTWMYLNPFGGHLGSVLGHFRPQNDTRISVKKGMIFGDVFCNIWVVFVVHF